MTEPAPAARTVPTTADTAPASPVAAANGTPPATGAAADVVRTLLEAVRAGDLATVRATIDERCVTSASHALPWGGDHRGPDGFEAILRRMGALFRARLLDYELFGAGDTAIVRARTRFTGRATDATTEMSVVEVYRVAGGRIVAADIYYKDPAEIARVSGAGAP